VKAYLGKGCEREWTVLDGITVVIALKLILVFLIIQNCITGFYSKRLYQYLKNNYLNLNLKATLKFIIILLLFCNCNRELNRVILFLLYRLNKRIFQDNLIVFAILQGVGIKKTLIKTLCEYY